MTQPERRETIRRQDYQHYPYNIIEVDLRVDLDPRNTEVTSRLRVERNLGVDEVTPMVLPGENLTLQRVVIDGRKLSEDEYLVDDQRLVLDKLPGLFDLEVVVTINPEGNTALEGLYMSNGRYCTQCEAEGFRKITYYPDRPDVLSRFTTTVIGNVENEPVLLANGNPLRTGELPEGRHFVTWEDPFPKPSYLFALVAGDLTCIEDSYTTASGREVALQFFVEERNADKCEHAMQSLKQAMRWDEERFGLEYDLDIYMVVAVDDFNMGAMENKGLNVFNSKYVLAKPETATDADFQAIQGVIGHEYFHNWTGNRVTCRDWFQLSLKEGLTVYRDQEFSADMTSRAVKRIEEVRILRAAQFPEDSGPLAHPVRPDSYVEINNFYTTTVYNKGAEVVRMQATLLGREGFRKGMELYFERHDGQAVAVDDFVAAMADANGADLEQFKRWYSQAGTPIVEARGHYNPEKKSYTLTLHQQCPATPGQEYKQPFHIPVSMGLVNKEGRDIPLKMEGKKSAASETTRVLSLREQEQHFEFTGIDEEPLPSLFRDFSAPVKVRYPYSREQRAFLMAHDSDPFNRWEAAQQLATELLLERLNSGNTESELDMKFAEACRAVLRADESDAALRALMLTLPGETYLAEQTDQVDPIAVHTVRKTMRRQLAHALEEDWWKFYQRYVQPGPYQITPEAIGRRSLRNLALGYLGVVESEKSVQLAVEHYQGANNMTDSIAALAVLVDSTSHQRSDALADFARRWQHDPLVMDKWFTVQALSSSDQVLDEVVRLMKHDAFSLRNPNKVRALIGAFAHANPAGFHRADGRGYRFVADQVLELDQINPQVAARMATSFTRWRRFDEQRQAMMKRELERISGSAKLSEDVHEIVSKSLNG